MIRCPACESTDSIIIDRVRLDDGHAADKRECAACGEQWMRPIAADAHDTIEFEDIELRDDDGVDEDDSPQSEGDVEEWFK